MVVAKISIKIKIKEWVQEKRVASIIMMSIVTKIQGIQLFNLINMVANKKTDFLENDSNKISFLNTKY